MKIATLYRKDGKVVLETDSDAITQVATDTPQDVVVMDAYHFTGERLVGRPPALAAPYGQDVPPQGIAALRQIATELRTRHVAFADRIDAAIRGLDNDRPTLCDLCQVREEAERLEALAGIKRNAS